MRDRRLGIRAWALGSTAASSASLYCGGGGQGRDKKATRSSGYSKMKLLTNVHCRLSPEVRHLEPCTSAACETLSVDFPMLLSGAIRALVEVQSVGKGPVYLHTSAD